MKCIWCVVSVRGACAIKVACLVSGVCPSEVYCVYVCVVCGRGICIVCVCVWCVYCVMCVCGVYCVCISMCGVYCVMCLRSVYCV